MRAFPMALAVLIGLSTAGCARANDGEIVKRQDEIVISALDDVELLRAFKRHFPESKHFISYITGRDGRTTWNSKAPLFGRYVFQMRVPVSIDRETLKVRIEGPPSFELKEVSVIESLPDGRQQVQYGKVSSFGVSDWNRFEAANGDFEVLGVKLKEDKPVTGFSDYLKY